MLVPAGAAPNTATWTLDVPSSGTYQVYARWTQHPNRATDAKYTVAHAAGSTQVTVNMEAGGGSWNLLGTFDFNAGPASVSLTDQANGFVIADAIRLVPVNLVVEKKLYFIEVDHLNTPRLITDDQQRVVWKWEQTEPFGDTPPDENPSGLGVFEQPLRFPGQYFDRETNLAYNWHRDYDLGIGRYVQGDPIGLRGGINIYSYTSASPIRYVDSRGLNPGDLFATLDDAAIDAAIYARRFLRKDIEYGGWIHKVGACYTYTFAIGGPGSIPAGTMLSVRPAVPYALWHTHDSSGSLYDNIFSDRDVATARGQRIPIYLRTPSGDDKVFDPATGQERVVSSALNPQEPKQCDQCSNK